MSLLSWFKNEFGMIGAEAETQFQKAAAKVENLVGKYAGPIEVAMATQAKAEYAMLTPAIWSQVQGFAAKASAAMEKTSLSGSLKWATAMDMLEADLKTIGVTVFSTTTKETLLQTATDIVKAGLFAGLTAAGVPTPVPSATSAPSSLSKAP